MANTAEETPPTVAEIPPAPIIPTRVAIPFLVFGNLLLVAFVYCLWANAVSAWILCIASFAVALFGSSVDVRNQGKVRENFVSSRVEEIEGFYNDKNAATERANLDFSKNVDLAPTAMVVALPMVAFVLSTPVAIFIEVTTYLSSWAWILRWGVALVAAVAGLGCFMGLWATANFTLAPVSLDYASARRQTADTTPLAALNDIQIIRQAASLDNLERRIETYTLEGALLSALSFSSFLAIFIEHPDMETRLSALAPPTWSGQPSADPWKIPLIGDIAPIGLSPLDYITHNVLELICLSLLMCAVTFLGVLVARLRFNDGFRDAESCVNSARRFNELEDKAIENKDAETERAYATEIDSMLARADKLEKGLNLTVMHMRLSRNAGILFFVITLGLCGLFFNWIVSISIFSLFLVTLLLGYIDQFVRRVLRKDIFRGKLGEILSQGRG